MHIFWVFLVLVSINHHLSDVWFKDRLANEQNYHVDVVQLH